MILSKKDWDIIERVFERALARARKKQYRGSGDEADFLKRIDAVLFSDSETAASRSWEGTASALNARLKASPGSSWTEDWTGRLLGSLAKSNPERVSKLRIRNGYQFWRISAPLIS